MDCIYYISNTVDQDRTQINGYFFSLPEAKEALKECSDWYRSKGTGRIWRVEPGLNRRPVIVYEN